MIRRCDRSDAAPGARSLPLDTGEHAHVVQFYETEAFLFETVGRFLLAGLKGGDRVVVIATARHREGFVRSIGASEAERAIASGQLTVLDAHETLATFMESGRPVAERFHAVVAETFRAATLGHGEARIRAYGEMVDVLWREGNPSAAVDLEHLWNEASVRHSFSLLCAYTMAGFYTEGAASRFVEVCREHDQVLPTEAAPHEEHEARLHEFEGLRQRTRALEVEIEQRKKVEQALRRALGETLNASEERFRLLVESVAEYAIFMLDAAGLVTTWNAGAERITGYTVGDILGKHASTLYPTEDGAGRCDLELEAARRDGRYETEGWRVRKGGTPFWASVALSALKDPTGRLVGFANVTRDLSDRRRAEEERARLAGIEDAERRKDDFLAIMGHELRNPLTPMVMAVRLIKLRGGRATDKELGILDRQLRHMTRLVEDLLDASRALRDQVALAPAKMETAEVVANAVDIASRPIEERGLRLTVDVPAEGLAVDVDPERMAQVFGNILNNAAKFTERGGSIHLSARSSGDQVEVVVQDTGRGIAPHLLERIFEPFTQGDPSADKPAGGLGVGLAVARRLVREHRGEILAHSDGPGMGSRFTVRLPRASPVVDVRSSAVLPALGKKRVPRRVVIVDDNQDSAEVMQVFLEHAGHDTRVVGDGLSAIELCSRFRPHAVFLDIGLPGLSGYEVASRLRAIAGCERIPIVAVSGYARPVDRARALASGFSEHVPKPIDLDHLEALMDDLVPDMTGY
jgi:PAS domain S-box-containing protein